MPNHKEKVQQVEEKALWFERNEAGRLEELREGDEPGPEIVLLTPLGEHHILAILGSLGDAGADDDLPAARQILVTALEKWRTLDA